MKIKSLFVAVLLMAGVVVAPSANAAEKPVIESFTFSPTEIELTNPDTPIAFEIVASHASGIDTRNVTLTISSVRNDTLFTTLVRTDSPINTSLKKVSFKGSLVLPRTMKMGVYSVSASSIWAGDRSLETGTIEPGDFRILPDAENSLLVRSSGDLNYEYATFIGPTFDNTLELSFQDPKYYLTPRQQLWKVGETFQPLDFYELRVKALSLEMTSTTPSTCTTDGKVLKLISVGGCSFTVFTVKTKDFAKKISERSVIITAARIKPTIVLQEIKNQAVADLDKTIEIPNVYAPGVGFVLPVSNTPTICYATGYFVKLTSGGTCTLRYQTTSDDSYLASDVYLQTFEIVKNSQTITFLPTTSVALSNKSLELSATTSSGGTVSFAAVPADICAVTGTILSLLKPGSCAVTATQPGTGTIAAVSSSATVLITGALPVVKKTITCVKGKKTVKKTAVSPKCPAGYKLKK